MLAGDGPATARQERKIRHANSEIWDKRQGNKAMSIRNLLKSMRAKAGYTVEGFARDARGVAAVEFAFIAPIMILLFVGTIELSAGISTDRKISRVASAIAAELQNHAGLAIETLAALAANNWTKDGPRVQACRHLLEYGERRLERVRKRSDSLRS